MPLTLSFTSTETNASLLSACASQSKRKRKGRAEAGNRKLPYLVQVPVLENPVFFGAFLCVCAKVCYQDATQVKELFSGSSINFDTAYLEVFCVPPADETARGTNP